MDLLEELLSKLTTSWKPFLEDEFKSAILKCNNTLTSRPDKMFWRYIKKITQNDIYL